MRNDDEYTRQVLDDEEQYCKQRIALLQKEYAAVAKPYIDRLVRIYSLRPAPAIIVTNDQLRAIGLEITDK